MTNSPNENELESQSLIREVPEVWPYRPVPRSPMTNFAPKYGLIEWQQETESWVMLATGNKEHILSEQARLKGKGVECFAFEITPIGSAIAMPDNSEPRDRSAAAKTLMEVGWTFDEVVAVLKMEGDRP